MPSCNHSIPGLTFECPDSEDLLNLDRRSLPYVRNGYRPLDCGLRLRLVGRIPTALTSVSFVGPPEVSFDGRRMDSETK